MKSKWSIVTVYESPGAREAAVAFCKALVERFWARFDFEVSSWSFEALEDEDAREQGACAATGADLMVFAMGHGEELPWHVRAWIETWLSRRQEREGALAALCTEGEPQDELTHAYLRQVALRAGMDFLTEVPEHLHDPFEDSTEFYTERAKTVTHVLDGILNRPTPPPLF